MKQAREISSNVFDLIDIDGDGEITKEELKLFYRKIGVVTDYHDFVKEKHSVLNSMVDKAFKEADKNGDNKLSRKEFFEHILKAHFDFEGENLPSEEELELFFAGMDIIRFTCSATELTREMDMAEENKAG